MTTLADIASNVADQLARDDLDTQIKAQIPLVVRRYNREATFLHEVHDAQFNTAAGFIWYTSFNLANSDGFADYSAGDTALSAERLISVRYARVVENSLDDQLYQLDIKRFLYWHENSVQGGEITHYCLWAGQLGLWPTPNSVLQVKLTGVFQPTVPTADADTSIWFDQYQELIEAGVRRRINQHYLKDYEAAQADEREEGLQLGTLRAETARRVGTGRVRARYY